MSMLDTDFRDRVIGSLAKLEEQMEQLLGNGQPGRLHLLEEKVQRHDKMIWMTLGGAALIVFGAKILAALLGAHI